MGCAPGTTALARSRSRRGRPRFGSAPSRDVERWLACSPIGLTGPPRATRCPCNDAALPRFARSCLLVPAVGCQGVDGRCVVGDRCVGGAWACCGTGVCRRTPWLTSALDAGWFSVGYMMWWGVRADGLRPLGVTRPLLAGRGRQQGCGNWPRFIVDRWACRATVGLGGDRLERLVTETAQHVVAALQQLARDGDARAVAAEPLGELFVIDAVRATRAPRRLRCLGERPAQRGRSVPGQVPADAVLV